MNEKKFNSTDRMPPGKTVVKNLSPKFQAHIQKITLEKGIKDTSATSLILIREGIRRMEERGMAPDEIVEQIKNTADDLITKIDSGWFQERLAMKGGKFIEVMLDSWLG